MPEKYSLVKLETYWDNSDLVIEEYESEEKAREALRTCIKNEARSIAETNDSFRTEEVWLIPGSAEKVDISSLQDEMVEEAEAELKKEREEKKLAKKRKKYEELKAFFEAEETLPSE